MQPSDVQDVSHIVEPTKQDYAVPQFILSQLKASPVSGYFNAASAMMAWGTERMIGSDAQDQYGQGWLRLKVNSGKFFRGWIRIILHATGQYSIRFEGQDHRSGEVMPQKLIERVPADQVVSTIDVVLFGPMTEESPKG
jgi:hypothetical protein